MKTLLITFFATVALLWWAQTTIFRISMNFEEVDPGKFYRSAQLTEKDFQEVVQKYKIKTVISVRGEYLNERAILSKLNVNYIPLNWTLDYFPPTDQFKPFLEALKSDQYPILVHCRTGADRTGEASAIYGIEFLKQTKEDAIKQHMSWRTYHVQAFHPAKAEFVRRFKGIDTMLKNYNSCDAEYKDFQEPGKCN